MAGVYVATKLQYIGKVGTGFGQDKVRRIMPGLKAAASDKSPFPATIRAKETRDRMGEAELVAEIESTALPTDGNMRQAAFKGLREDKPPRKSRRKCHARTEPRRSPAAKHWRCAKPAANNGPRSGAWYDLESRQEAVAEGGEGRAHQARPRRIFRGGRRMDDRAFITGRPCSIIRAPEGIQSEREILPAPRQQGLIEAVRSSSRSPATRKPICRSIDSTH